MPAPCTPRKPPQTEEEERAALIYSAGWLSGRALHKTGRLPRVLRDKIDRDGDIDFSKMSPGEIGRICDEIRSEMPEDVGDPFE